MIKQRQLGWTRHEEASKSSSEFSRILSQEKLEINDIHKKLYDLEFGYNYENYIYNEGSVIFIKSVDKFSLQVLPASHQALWITLTK